MAVPIIIIIHQTTEHIYWAITITKDLRHISKVAFNIGRRQANLRPIYFKTTPYHITRLAK